MNIKKYIEDREIEIQDLPLENISYPKIIDFNKQTIKTILKMIKEELRVEEKIHNKSDYTFESMAEANFRETEGYNTLAKEINNKLEELN